MAVVEVYSLTKWIASVTIAFVGLIITGTIFSREWRRRRTEKCAFTNHWFKITSAVCIVCGPMLNIFLILAFIPGFCLMDEIPRTLSFVLQFLSMGFYQLSRLYYCFSSHQVHSDKGYPLWVFMIMAIFGLMLLVSWAVCYTVIDTLTTNCGFRYESDDRSLYFFWNHKEHSVLFDNEKSSDIYSLWISLHGACAQIWDVITLLLYSYKIWKFTKLYKCKDSGIWRKILSILYRIVIITVFYQLCLLFCVLSHRVESALWENDVVLGNAVLMVLLSIILSFSMYLMMEHNTKEYIEFLYFLRRFKLNFCCCCCRHIVDQQLEELQLPELPPRHGNVRSESMVQTEHPNISVNDVYRIENQQNSLDTATVEYGDMNRDRTVTD